MTSETENKKENTIETKDVSATENQQQSTETVDNKGSQASTVDLSGNIQALQEKLDSLTNKLVEKEKLEQTKAQTEQVKKLEAKVLEMTKKLEEQTDMASSTRVDGGSSISGTPIQTEINLNFRSSDPASWEKAAQQFLKNFQANNQ